MPDQLRMVSVYGKSYPSHRRYKRRLISENKIVLTLGTDDLESETTIGSFVASLQEVKARSGSTESCKIHRNLSQFLKRNRRRRRMKSRP